MKDELPGKEFTKVREERDIKCEEEGKKKGDVNVAAGINEWRGWLQQSAALDWVIKKEESQKENEEKKAEGKINWKMEGEREWERRNWEK